jgi:hypothetical protein
MSSYKIQKFIKDLLNSFRQILPTDMMEVLLFITVLILFIVLINLTHNTSVFRRIKETSRCYRNNKDNSVLEGIFKLKAYANNGDNIFDITYDTSSNSYIIDQKCEQGKVLNKVLVKVYDMKRQQPETLEKIFMCNKDYNLSINKPYYKGDLGLVRFMELDDTTFFDDRRVEQLVN